MPCIPIRMADGSVALVNVARSYVKDLKKCWVSHCRDYGVRLCDFPVGEGKTCDHPICFRHATQKGPEVDYCPEHKDK